jgi:hypothetical protein
MISHPDIAQPPTFVSPDRKPGSNSPPAQYGEPVQRVGCSCPTGCRPPEIHGAASARTGVPPGRWRPPQQMTSVDVEQMRDAPRQRAIIERRSDRPVEAPQPRAFRTLVHAAPRETCLSDRRHNVESVGDPASHPVAQPLAVGRRARRPVITSQVPRRRPADDHQPWPPRHAFKKLAPLAGWGPERGSRSSPSAGLERGRSDERAGERNRGRLSRNYRVVRAVLDDCGHGSELHWL